MIGTKLPLTHFAAFPNAIPETEWYVVAVDADGRPERKGKGWNIRSTHASYAEAAAQAAWMTALMRNVVF